MGSLCKTFRSYERWLPSRGRRWVRHLTPARVSALLNLKAAYVHELCRTVRLPAVKHGKYWLIPQAALRDRLANRPGDIDGGVGQRLASLNFRGHRLQSARDNSVANRHLTE